VAMFVMPIAVMLMMLVHWACLYARAFRFIPCIIISKLVLQMHKKF